MLHRAFLMRLRTSLNANNKHPTKRDYAFIEKAFVSERLSVSVRQHIWSGASLEPFQNDRHTRTGQREAPRKVTDTIPTPNEQSPSTPITQPLFELPTQSRRSSRASSSSRHQPNPRRATCHTTVQYLPPLRASPRTRFAHVFHDIARLSAFSRTLLRADAEARPGFPPHACAGPCDK